MGLQRIFEIHLCSQFSYFFMCLYHSNCPVLYHAGGKLSVSTTESLHQGHFLGILVYMSLSDGAFYKFCHSRLFNPFGFSFKSILSDSFSSKYFTVSSYRFLFNCFSFLFSSQSSPTSYLHIFFVVLGICLYLVSMRFSLGSWLGSNRSYPIKSYHYWN